MEKISMSTTSESSEKGSNNKPSSVNEQDGGNLNVKILSLVIKDVKVLYTAFMPFISNGGLFIPTKKNFNMGDVIPLIITLLDENNKYSVNGKVVWITPQNAHNRIPGIGVQFSGENSEKLYQKIILLLAKFSSSKELTNTM